jgi:hypothetical protein
MSYQQRDNSGALFKNDKGDNPSRPDYRGDVMVDGQQYEVAAWIKEGNKGKFMSLSLKPKEDQQRQAPPQRQAPTRQAPSRSQSAAPDMDDVPFSNPLAGRAWLAM